jgi:hypothetical protein
LVGLLSGTTYAFEVHPLGTFFQSLPGIYVICKEAPPKTLNALYVGETHDFDNRVGEGFPTHHKWAAAIVRGATHICVMVVSGDNAARLRIERDLRHGLNPLLDAGFSHCGAPSAQRGLGEFRRK